jgi:hypothetical protein
MARLLTWAENGENGYVGTVGSDELYIVKRASRECIYYVGHLEKFGDTPCFKTADGAKAACEADHAERRSPTSLDEALAVVKAAGYRISKPRTKVKFENGRTLNAVGKPFSPSYGPKYRLKFKPRTGHLFAPYPTTMRFVGDDHSDAEKKEQQS